MELRPHQERAITAVLASLRAGKRAPLLVLPTGAGKTVTACELARRHVAKGGRVLWVTHLRALVEQARAALARAGAQAEVTSVQALLAAGSVPDATLRIWDEARHYVSDEWRRVHQAYAGSGFDLGLDATPERADGQGLGDMFDDLIIGATPRELLEAGLLVPCEVVRPEAPLESGQIAQSPVAAYEEHARGRSALVFARHLRDARTFAEDFRLRGHVAAEVYGETPAGQRDAAVEAFREGRIRVIVSVGCLTEGFDAPIADVAILARGCGSAGQYLQIAGRVLRPHPGKRDALLIDLRGSSHHHGDPYEDREYSLTGAAIRRRNAGALGLCVVCGASVTPGEPCAECGSEGREVEDSRVVNARLARYAAMRGWAPSRQVAWLAKNMRTAAEKGYKRGWWVHRFRVVFGRWPAQADISAAERL